MMKLKQCIALAAMLALMITGCKKDEPALPDNLLQFEASEQGFASTETETTIKLSLSRATDRDIAISVTLTDSAIAYGTEYTTTPAAAAGKLSLNIPNGGTSVSFTVKKATGVLLDGDEKVTFKIETVAAPVLSGTKSQLALSFSEIIAAQASSELDGGGPTYPNKVFIDLSANRQTSVVRNAWDLGFYGGDEFRVILNSSSAMMAKQIDKNDLNAVTAADTVGFGATVIFNQLAPTTESLAFIDYPSGDLTKTAIAEISATADDNKVYIINRGKSPGTTPADRGWKKVRIIRNGSGGYTVQHADIAATTFEEVQIEKSPDYFFKYVSFETGAIDIEPKKTKWDIAWTYFSNATFFGAGEVPYTFQDVILQNRNVEIAKILIADKAYDAFSEADLAALTFNTTQLGIGTDWRSGGGPTSGPALRTDRYYIIKDGDGNYYKLKFTALTKDGQRGFPAVEYALVKAG